MSTSVYHKQLKSHKHIKTNKSQEIARAVITSCCLPVMSERIKLFSSTS